MTGCLVGDVGEARGVVVVHDAGVDAGSAAAQRGGVDVRAFDGFPGGFQQQSLLRVHRQRLARRDAEEGGVEFGRVVEETTRTHVTRAGRIGVVIEECFQRPSPIVREPRDRVGAGAHQFP